jgi:pimeloyl-ACP methyl ester carboxylesterase
METTVRTGRRDVLAESDIACAAMTAATIGNGLTIEYEVTGEGPPLLLVMGLGAQLIAWPQEFVDRLASRGYMVIRHDNRDIGLSSLIDAPAPSVRRMILAVLWPRFAKSTYTIDDMADDAVGLLDHLDVGPTHIVGASMGGMIVQAMAIRHPRRVASLVSIMSNTGDRKNGRAKRSVLLKLPRTMAKTPEEAVEKGLEAFRLTAGSQFDEEAVRVMIKESLERSYRPEGAARQTMAIAASPDRTWELGRVRVPTVVVHGLADPLVQPSGAMATTRAIPGAKLVMYPDMGHDLPRQRWDDIIAEIVDNARKA